MLVGNSEICGLVLRPPCVKRSQAHLWIINLHISKVICLGKDVFFYILIIRSFCKSIKYLINEKQEGQPRDYFALIYETGNKNECLWKYTAINEDDREYFNTKSDASDF